MKRIKELYNMATALIASIILNAIVIGLLIVLPLYFFVFSVNCGME